MNRLRRVHLHEVQTGFTLRLPPDPTISRAVRDLPGRTYNPTLHTWFIPKQRQPLQALRQFVSQYAPDHLRRVETALRTAGRTDERPWWSREDDGSTA